MRIFKRISSKIGEIYKLEVEIKFLDTPKKDPMRDNPKGLKKLSQFWRIKKVDGLTYILTIFFTSKGMRMFNPDMYDLALSKLQNDISLEYGAYCELRVL